MSNKSQKTSTKIQINLKSQCSKKEKHTSLLNFSSLLTSTTLVHFKYLLVTTDEILCKLA